MENSLVRLIGLPATIVHGDPTVYDRWKWLKRHLLKGPKRTLDAGCGTGNLTLFAGKNGNTAIGISFNERNIRIASKRAEILGIKNVSFIEGDLRDFDKISPELGTFDQILCFETIEHLIDDQKLLNSLCNALKCGGRLLLTAPFKEHVPVMGESTDRNFVSNIEDGGHVRYGYTELELRTRLSKAGFDTEKVEFISGLISQTLYNLWCHLDQYLPHKLTWALTFPLRILQMADPLVTHLLNYPHLSIGVVATRPPTKNS